MKMRILMASFAIGVVGIVGHAKEATQKVILSVTENGFEPKTIDVKPGINVVLEVTRKTDSTCANQIQVPAKKIKVELPRDKMVSIALGRLEKGEIRFGCGMNMMEAGQIIAR